MIGRELGMSANYRMGSKDWIARVLACSVPPVGGSASLLVTQSHRCVSLFPRVPGESANQWPLSCRRALRVQSWVTEPMTHSHAGSAPGLEDVSGEEGLGDDIGTQEQLTATSQKLLIV